MKNNGVLKYKKIQKIAFPMVCSLGALGVGCGVAFFAVMVEANNTISDMYKTEEYKAEYELAENELAEKLYNKEITSEEYTKGIKNLKRSEFELQILQKYFPEEKEKVDKYRNAYTGLLLATFGCLGAGMMVGLVGRCAEIGEMAHEEI